MLPSSEMKPSTMRKLRAGLFTRMPGLLHFLRQQRHGELQLVLHLHLRDVGIGALREGQRDRGRAVGVALGR